ncbi:hypothetical protein ACWGJ2_39565 [Streptomyces sp. NPDC054796]
MSTATRFQLLVRERGWASFATFSMHFAKAAHRAAEQEGDPRLARAAPSKRSFVRWMSDDFTGRPQGPLALVLTHLFNMSIERLFARVDPGLAVRRSSTALSAEEAARAVHLEFDNPLQVASQTEKLTISSAGAELIETLTRSMHSIVARYETLGPQQLSGEARLMRSMLHSVLGGQQTPRVRSELFQLAGHAAGLLGYMAVNAGADAHVSEAYCTESEALAREVGDTHLEMWAAGTRSLGLYYHGRYVEADAAAKAGIALAPHSPHAIRLLANGRARALARMDDRRGAERAIGQALEISEQQASLPGGLTPCIAFSPYSPARTLANVATARLSLRDTREVLACANEIDALLEESDSEWSRALVGLDVATALLQQESPELDHAMALGRSALRTGTSAPIRSVWQRARELYVHAGRWHNEPVVGDYAEELLAWKSLPQAEPIVTGVRAAEASS